jgi:energy-coupling factor transporter ATP-binding protein EcfA2
MRVSRLEAENVHGYLAIRVDFLPDLTFLTGLNGSGKTTALRLLMGLLAPDLEELGSIIFHRATATVLDQGREVVLEAIRSSDGLSITTSEAEGVLAISSAELQLIAENRQREEPRPNALERISAHAVFQRISKMSTPMFLGLDRRFSVGSTWDDSIRIRRRIATRRIWSHGGVIRTGAVASLADVDELVYVKLGQIRASQEHLDDELRSQILLDAFRYEPTQVQKETNKPPKRTELEAYKARQAAVEKAAAGLSLPLGEVQSALTTFFERMNQVVDALEEQAKPTPTGKKNRKASDELERTVPEHVVVEWLLNKSQADRIFNHIQLLEGYGADRAKLHEPIDRFLSLGPVRKLVEQVEPVMFYTGCGVRHRYPTPFPFSVALSGRENASIGGGCRE